MNLLQSLESARACVDTLIENGATLDTIWEAYIAERKTEDRVDRHVSRAHQSFDGSACSIYSPGLRRIFS
jgi:hypothetical protein